MVDAPDHTPAEVRVGLDHYGVTEALRRLLSRVSAERGLTADPPGKGYVAVRPATWGNVSAYFHASYVDVAVAPGHAEKLHRTHGWKLVKTNSETGFVRIESAVLADPVTDAVAFHTLLAAVDKSAVGTAYEGGRPAAAQVGSEIDLCPTCFVARAQGRCDVCD
jgi:hypothetical protein